jgi:hypothetical protein
MKKMRILFLGDTLMAGKNNENDQDNKDLSKLRSAQRLASARKATIQQQKTKTIEEAKENIKIYKMNALVNAVKNIQDTQQTENYIENYDSYRSEGNKHIENKDYPSATIAFEKSSEFAFGIAEFLTKKIALRNDAIREIKNLKINNEHIVSLEINNLENENNKFQNYLDSWKDKAKRMESLATAARQNIVEITTIDTPPLVAVTVPAPIIAPASVISPAPTPAPVSAPVIAPVSTPVTAPSFDIDALLKKMIANKTFSGLLKLETTKLKTDLIGSFSDNNKTLQVIEQTTQLLTQMKPQIHKVATEMDDNRFLIELNEATAFIKANTTFAVTEEQREKLEKYTTKLDDVNFLNTKNYFWHFADSAEVVPKEIAENQGELKKWLEEKKGILSADPASRAEISIPAGPKLTKGLSEGNHRLNIVFTKKYSECSSLNADDKKNERLDSAAVYDEHYNKSQNRVYSSAVELPENLDPKKFLKIDSNDLPTFAQTDIDKINECLKIYAQHQEKNKTPINQKDMEMFLTAQPPLLAKTLKGGFFESNLLHKITATCMQTYNDNMKDPANPDLPSKEMMLFVAKQVESIRESARINTATSNPEIRVSSGWAPEYVNAVSIYCKLKDYPLRNNSTYPSTQYNVGQLMGVYRSNEILNAGQRTAPKSLEEMETTTKAPPSKRN